MTDATIDIVRARAATAIRGKVNVEKFNQAFDEETNKPVIIDFLTDGTHKLLVVTMPATDRVVCTLDPSTIGSQKAVYFLKADSCNDTVGKEEFDSGLVLVSEIAGDGQASLWNLHLLAHEVYFPLLSNPANRAGWSGPTAKQVMLKLGTFLFDLTTTVGESKGETILPDPPAEAFDEDSLSTKDRAQLLQTSIVKWTKKLEAVLKTDPSDAMAKGKTQTPADELAFWEAKATDLEALSKQLASPKMKAVLQALMNLQDTYAYAFTKLIEQVNVARDQAKENIKFLSTLDSYINQLAADLDFGSLEDIFPPMMHVLLLVWQNSKSYNTEQRLTCFLQEVSNAVIAQAQNYVNGEALFRFIDDENCNEAVHNLNLAKQVCTAFKNAFLRYQVKARNTPGIPEGAWDIKLDVVFKNLDMFVVRCQDMLQFTKIVAEFTKLEKVILGGNMGHELTESILTTHRDFFTAVEVLKVVDYDLMDITVPEFDDHYFKFGCQVNTLEERLSAVLVQAFDDAPTMDSKFKLLENFEGLTDRAIIANQLHLKKIPLIQTYTNDLATIHEIFIKNKDNPIIDKNMPPVAGALTWCRGLLTRAQEPMERLREITAGIHPQPVEEMEKVYEAITAKLKLYEKDQVEAWAKEVDSTSDAKLKQALLRRRDEIPRLLSVNFDEVLVRLLREVKYLLLLGLTVAPKALAIYEMAEQYRVQIGNLELVVHMYNDMMSTLHMVERPLVEKEIAHIDEVLEKGISELNWTSASVDEFDADAIKTVKIVFDTVQVMKNNFESIKKMMGEYAKVPLADRKNKPLSPQDFEDNLKKLWVIRHDKVKEHQDTISKLLKETNETLNVNKGSPIWRAYVEYVQDHVRDELAFCIITSIDFLCKQLDQPNIDKNGLQPLLEIKLGLYANDILFNADDGGAAGDGEKGRKSGRRDVWQIMNDWVENFFEIGNIMTRMDGSHYVGDLKKNEGIVRFIKNLKKHLDWNQKECENYRQEYTKYEFLWKTDRSSEFKKFLTNAMKPEREKKEEDEEDDEDEEAETSSKDAPANELPLHKFEEKILHYKELLAEINDKPTLVEIGWLKVNSAPVKAALETWVSKWISTYTSHLYSDVTRKLTQLEVLMNDVDAGVKVHVKPGDSETLKEVLGFIHQILTRNKSTTQMFQPLRESVNLLKKYGKNLDEYELKLLSDVPMKWDRTVSLVFKVKEQVLSLQNEEVEVIIVKIEDFSQRLKHFRKKFRKEAPFTYDMSINTAYDLINKFHQQITVFEVEAAKLIDLEQVFELTASKHFDVTIRHCRNENQLLKHIWDMISIVKTQFGDWKKTLWDDIDTDSLVTACKKLLRQVKSSAKEVQGFKVYIDFEADVKNFQTVLPLVNLLHSPCLMERHWKELKQKTGKHFEKSADFCLADLLDLELHLFVEEVEYIVELATKEDKIGKNLVKIESAWEDLILEFGEHSKDGSDGVPIIVAPDEILVNLEENMATLQGMQGQGKYVEHFLTEVTKWLTDLGNTESVILDWLEVQGKWQSLETIFLGSKDIRTQLPEDSKRFDSIDATFRALQTSGKQTPKALDACNVKGRNEVLSQMLGGLEKCEKSLFQYLETKRKAFPRFYFLANAALLDILSNGYDPQCVQKHLGDCFDNMKFLEYHKGEKEGTFTNVAHGMHSKDGKEFVEFPIHPRDNKKFDFVAEGPVEDWLNGLVAHQQEALKEILYVAKSSADNWEIEKPRETWLLDFPAQIALTASQIVWTEETTTAFDSFAEGNEQAMKDFVKTCGSRLQALIVLVLGKLEKSLRVKVITLITVDVHNRDVIQRMIDDKITDVTQFAWQSQMRYEWFPDNRECNVRVADAFFNYSYEYVGNTGRLVITPLTDRCYITLTQALRLVMGGAPAGPAGTGKTETTKDLGRALGLPVYVFNCSEQMNVSSMGAIYKGLAATGAWGCFDEFNRVPIEVLSVVATQVAQVLAAIREKKATFNFMGEMCELTPTVGMFITMNPGYAGRTELPENLKALFRSCAMVVPDIELICENMLLSEGFLEARRLAKKFTTLYSLSKELLSKQMHYDWGLRACKAVLRVAGGLKRAEPTVDEDKILMRALRDFNLPKLVDDDKPIFTRLCNDLFQGLTSIRKFDEEVEKNIIAGAKQLGLQDEDVFVMKCVELNELLDIRHSVFVIGPAGSGKSEIWRTLYSAYNLMGMLTVTETLNPKAIRNKELYGFLTKTDWHDGVLSTIMRNMSRNNPPYTEKQVNKWIVLDGDIDPDWIESLNTVMDDNKMLTLVSNERIPLSDGMRLLFEISNLDNATPATVSRAGIIFINAKDVGYKPYLDSWIDKRKSEKERSQLLALFNVYTKAEFIYELRTNFKRVVPVTDVNMIQTLCNTLEGVLDRLNAWKSENKGSELDEAAEKERFESHFVFACVWALGGSMLVDKQNNFQKEFSEWWKRVFQSIKYPKEGLVFDYFPDNKTGAMTPWTDFVPPYSAPDDAYLVTKVFVPTMDTTRLTYVMDLLVQNQYPVQLVGTAGTGKTSLIQRYLNNIADPYVFTTISLNYYTDAKALQRILEGPLDKRSGRTFGPPNTKKLIYFLDDLNMPMVDVYNTQSPSALVRQHIDYGSWFDTVKLEKKEIKDVQYIACMNPTAGSFMISDRLQGNFMVFSTPLPSQTSLESIYNAVVQGHLSTFPKNVNHLSDVIVKSTISLHELVASKFLPSSKKFHYQFNLRDLSSVLQGVCASVPASKFTPGMFAKLWQHECTRVFCDRLVDSKDIEEYFKLQDAISQKKEFWKDALDSYEKEEKIKHEAKGDEEKAAPPIPNLWTSFHTGNYNYSQVPDFSSLKECLTGRLEMYNEQHAAMNLELFGAAMEHVCRICRIIGNPRGNALLVGVGGSGKQSLARLSSSICGYDVFQIAVTQSYGMTDLKEDLRELYTKTGVKDNQISFILTDTQIVDDEWLVFINDFLSTGFIPDLYNAEEMDGVMNGIRYACKSAGVPDDKGAMHDFFIEKVRQNLHLILCFSPVGSVFRLRCRKFPALINCTAIDWFHPWPRDALISVGFKFLNEVEMNTEEMRERVSVQMAECHLSVKAKSEEYLQIERRYNYTTPKSFLEFIAFYKQLLGQKRDDLDKQSARLEKGLVVIESTKRDVEELKENLVVTLQKVGEKTKAAQELIAKSNIEKAKVAEQQAIANIEEKKASGVSDIANKIKSDCEIDLKKAQPLMDAATEAVKCLSKSSLQTLKSFANPPGLCVQVTNACMILKGIGGKKDWGGGKKMMKDVSKFLDSLVNYDATDISDSILTKVQVILDMDGFNKEDMMKSSEAAANLCGWVINVVAYNKVYKEVAPKVLARDQASKDYEEAQATLKVVRDRVALMEQKLAKVTALLDGAMKEQQAVEDESKACQDRLGLAKRLVEGLKSEGSRWEEAVDGFQTRKATLVGDVLLAASFVSYIGAFNHSFRTSLWKDTWRVNLENDDAIDLTEGIDPLLILANDSDFAKWKNEGLAADRVSLENGAIINRCSRWPLMIDPQLQGIKWIRNRVKNLKVVQLNTKRWMRKICEAVSNGDTVLIEGVGEEIDGTLNPILSRSTVTRAGQQFIQIGEEEVQYSKDFVLILQTKLSNPHYIPEVAAQTTLINFIVTEEGLEEQLLAIVVNKEKPELEESRTALVRAINDYMVSLTDLENELLERLSNAPDDILSDVALIEGLEQTKKASEEIKIKVELGKEKEISINVARNEYRGVAAEASWLYFLLISINIISHMYQFSLDAFVSFFLKAMDKAKTSEKTEERVHFLREQVRIVVFTWVNRGLFEKHKLIFSSQLCFKLMQKGALKQKFDPKLFDFLVRAPKLMGIEKSIDWLPTTVWGSLQELIKLEGFSKFCSDMEGSPNRFKEWYNKSRPESSPLPLDWRKLDDTDPFKKLCILRAMRQDRMTTAMLQYVEQAIPNGKNYTECDGGKSFLDVLTMSLEDSTPVNPVFFILSSGADPISTLEGISQQRGLGDEKFQRVALGQGQDIVAMAKLAVAHKDGGWVVLENIHLMPRWCGDLEKQLDDYAVEGSHPDFRVFLTAEPAKGIPIGLLERSVKLTNEPPQGLKQNLKRALATFDKEEFDYKDPKVRSILFGLCHFHSIVIERGKFGPKGWNRVYPFGTGDLVNSAQVLQNYLENASDKVPWSDLRYIFGEIMYGGHITDDLDRLLCMTYQDFYIKPEILDEMEMYPFAESFPEETFPTPTGAITYDGYFQHIDENLHAETPIAFGLHPNAEIAVKTTEGDVLFRYILELQPRKAGGEEGENPADKIRAFLESILQSISSVNFKLEDIASAVAEDRGPYQNVFLQECERMNILTDKMRISLKELELGLNGELQISQKMEDLQNSLFMGRIPESWEKLAYPSLRNLSSWLADLILRSTQLQTWTEEPLNIPTVTELSYLFNPQSFLTAIMQLSAQKNKLELDKLVIMTDVTKRSVEQTDTKARDGAYVTGFNLEGARWNMQTGSLEECEAREMFCPLPVVCCRAILSDKLEKNGVYMCPVYKTAQRGPTYVFQACLRTKLSASKWVLAGACILMETPE